jgi:putative N6-adenine-specific DNA methylase
MCGSGTLLIEAAMIALGIPPESYGNASGSRSGAISTRSFSVISITTTVVPREFRYRIVVPTFRQNDRNCREKYPECRLKKYIDLSVQSSSAIFRGAGPEGCTDYKSPYGERIKGMSLRSCTA